MLRKFLPHSLFKRFLLIILLPNLIIQLLAVYIFYERHWSGVSKHMAVALAGDIDMLEDSLNKQPPEKRDEIIATANKTLYLNASFIKDGVIEPHEQIDDFETFNQELGGRISLKHSDLYYIGDKSEVALDLQLPDGLIHVVSSAKRLANPTTYIFIMWMTGTALVFLTISIFFMRNQVRAIIRLAIVAEKFGKGQDSEMFKPTGATEVRQVGQAFLDMKERIKRQIEQRTEMLAGVSHDLKTPLTRMKLQLAMMPASQEIGELQQDIIEMEKMVQGYLDFAKGNNGAISEPVNVSELLSNIVVVYKNNPKKIELQTPENIILNVNANAFRRVVSNIIDNALRYGEKVLIKAEVQEDNLLITIDDDGIGIPEKHRELVFKPFYRIDSSRHLENGSTGLGLSIARDIVTGYGGSIELGDSDIGGLRVLIRVPV
jgi:two-component system osmolarity sensor histidine kinase EnvZ